MPVQIMQNIKVYRMEDLEFLISIAEVLGTWSRSWILTQACQSSVLIWTKSSLLFFSNSIKSPSLSLLLTQQTIPIYVNKKICLTRLDADRVENLSDEYFQINAFLILHDVGRKKIDCWRVTFLKC